MKFKELTTKSEAEVRKMLEELQVESHALALKIRLSQEKTTHKLKGMKRDIARIMTYLHNVRKSNS